MHRSSRGFNSGSAGRPLRFVRCDSTGRELSLQDLNNMEFTNDTIDLVVSQVSDRFIRELRDREVPEPGSAL